MKEPPDIAAEPLPAARPQPRARWWIRPAPGPETPDGRDRKGAQLGMALALGGAALFWIVLGAVIVLLR